MASHLGQRNRHTACTGCGTPMTTYSAAPLCLACRAFLRDRVCALCGGTFRLRGEASRRTRRACPECASLYQHKSGGTWSPLLRKRA
jgi:hypothetical protein